MASNIALCVFALDLLISSSSTMFVCTGPSWVTKEFVADS